MEFDEQPLEKEKYKKTCRCGVMAAAMDFEGEKEMKVLGPYKNNCNRLIVIIGEKGNYKTVSYPKYLMEQYLGRPLSPNEDVHHKDGNPLNNYILNLEIKIHGEHQKEHSLKAPLEIKRTCFYCGKEFILSKQQRRKFMEKGVNERFFCSKSCRGKFGRCEQLRRDSYLNGSKFGEALPNGNTEPSLIEEGVETKHYPSRTDEDIVQTTNT